MSGLGISQNFLINKWWWIIAHKKDNFFPVMFHVETISQKRMVLTENQFSCKQIQGGKYIKIHKTSFYKISYWFQASIYTMKKWKNNLLRDLTTNRNKNFLKNASLLTKRQKDKHQNIKRWLREMKPSTTFQEKLIFPPTSDTHTCTYQRVRNIRNLDPFVSLNPSFYFPFYRWFKTCRKTTTNIEVTVTH